MIKTVKYDKTYYYYYYYFWIFLFTLHMGKHIKGLGLGLHSLVKMHFIIIHISYFKYASIFEEACILDLPLICLPVCVETDHSDC